jgi:hypothetical protein
MCPAEPFLSDVRRSGAASDKSRMRQAQSGTTVEFHDNAVPAYAADALDELYGSIYSTLDQFRLDNALAGASTYVARSGNRITALLLYRIDGGVATVLNQMIVIEREELIRFSKALFDRYGKVSAISLKPVQSDMRDFPFRCQHFHYAEDIVASLPETNVEYQAALGKNMRETVKRFGNKVRRSFPAYRFDIYCDERIDMGQAMEIYRLHVARMGQKMMRSNLSEQQFGKIAALARTRGIMAVATIDGKVCGGLIGWRTGAHYVMRVIAHDPRYDEFKIGTVCCYETIRECIALGMRHFHFGGGRMLYKFRLLGESRSFSSIVVYRSWMAVLRHPALAMRTAARGADRELRRWLENAEQSDDALARAAVALRRQWHAMRLRVRNLVRRPPQSGLPAGIQDG